MKLIDRLKDRFSSEADRARRERERLRGEYIALLKRADDPQPGDEERLEALLEALNMRLDMAEADATKLELVRQREAFESAIAEAREEQREAREEQKDYSADAERLARIDFLAGRDRANKRLSMANNLVRDLQSQLGEIDRLRETEPWLFS